jgi:quinol monooxygenase YgiN
MNLLPIRAQEVDFMVKKALAVKLVAKPGKEAEVEAFLNGGLSLVNDEPLTVTWYAIKFSENTFGIFDTFEGDEGRDAHLNGKVAEALMASAAELLAEPPSIEKVDILAVKTGAERSSSSVA